MAPQDEAVIEHIGIKRKSGRYPWGSGDTPYQRSKDFKAYYQELKDKGLSDAEIAKGLGLTAEGRPHSSSDIRAAVQNSTEEIRIANVARAKHLAAQGMSNGAIAEAMGMPRGKESTVRGWLKESNDIKEGSIKATAETLRRNVEEKPFLDVGKGTELFLGVSRTRMDAALASLRDEGFRVHTGIKRPQLGTTHMTEYKVLTKADKTWKDARDAVVNGLLMNTQDRSPDNGQTWVRAPHTPRSIDSKRVEIRTAEQGGKEMDGIIELRRGVPELDLGANRYGQVRVAVDGTHYMKGMAMYADNLPPGIDIRYNSAKTKAEAPGKLDHMKPLKVDKTTGELSKENVFGATTYHEMYKDAKGKEHQSVLNIVGTKGRGNLEGRWDQWAKSLSSQMLSKQSVKLANEQLGKTRRSKEKELDEILRLTNPVVKKKLLEEFSESADSAAEHLKAAHIPGQSSHVLLPMNSMRPNEIYAPNFNNGDRVALVRHPHGGPFEIPNLVVNNRNITARRILGNSKDAVGIHHSVAEQLSGADFDGDSVLVIPNNDARVKHRPPLQELKNFDPRTQYKIADDDTTTSRMSKKGTQTEMGKISNLITDMTIKGASTPEIARAVKHSMVVIDAEKHGLNYKQSEIDNGIKQLKTLYQEGPTKGAATLLSRAGAATRVPERKYLTGNKGIDPKTGERLFIETGRKITRTEVRVSKRTGQERTITKTDDAVTKGTKMQFAKDARSLLSKDPTKMEEVYADHANSMKALANRARKEMVAIPNPRQSKNAKAIYKAEVDSLNDKLKLALRNAPIERKAQALGNTMANARIDANPHLDKDDIKKIKYQELEIARTLTGANKLKIDITPREWQAIQAGAVSATRLADILRHGNKEQIREYATPRTRTSLTSGQLAKAKMMAASGRPMSEIAEALGIPRSTIADNLGRA